jgi:hypothetical protein
MKQIDIIREAVNFDQLDQTLSKRLADDYVGTNVAGNQVQVYLRDSAGRDTLAQARQIVNDHDATVLTDTQQARQERKNRLETARANDVPITLDEVQNESPLLRAMAQKLRRLELEIDALRSE